MNLNDRDPEEQARMRAELDAIREARHAREREAFETHVERVIDEIRRGPSASAIRSRRWRAESKKYAKRRKRGHRYVSAGALNDARLKGMTREQLRVEVRASLRAGRR